MRIAFNGKLVDEPRIRAGFIGCGSHSFRNLYPVMQFVPVELVTVCDLDSQKAEAFKSAFGAKSAYSDHHKMLEQEKLDAVFICTGYDKTGRPLYPSLAIDCLNAGCHVWTEKPPAASCAEIDRMKKAADKNHKNVVVGLKKMFFPANRKAKELMQQKDFGSIELVTIQYPQYVPMMDEFKTYAAPADQGGVRGFLDHLCHPASLMIYLLGMPDTLHYTRSRSGAGTASFTFSSGAVASMVFSQGAANNGGMERTMIVGNKGQHITVENNLRVTLHKNPPDLGYGTSPSYYTGSSEKTSAVWEPEFSLGQLYNKGIFLLGYYDEINEFVRSVLEKRSPDRGTLDHAWQVTKIFEAFFKGPNTVINID
jgi:predicted dehydrogenase